MAGAQINVDGQLIVLGTQGAQVTFTTLNPGEQWQGITNVSVAPTMTMNHCTISNAATGLNVGSWATLSMDHCIFSNCFMGINIYAAPSWQTPLMQITNNTLLNFPLNSSGISIEGTSNVLLTNNVVSGPVAKGTGIYLSGSSPQIQLNSVENWKYGLVCVNGSSPTLETGFNTIANNNTGIFCDHSDALLSVDVGENTICLNGVDVHLDTSKVSAIRNRWRSNDNPPGIFYVDNASELAYDPWLERNTICGETRPILAGGNGELREEERMTFLSPFMRQIMRERIRGNFVQAAALIRAIINNRTVSDEEKIWALGQMLAIGQRMRNGDLAFFFNSLAASPTLGRRARALLPMSFMHEGSLAQAVAAYEANIRQYPSSSEARTGLFGKFTYTLYHQRDTSQARMVLNQLQAEYPLSVEAEIAEVQMRSFRLSSVGSNPTGGFEKMPTSSTVSSLPNIPTQFALSQNYPNPFNPMTTISYDVPVASHVTIKLYDLIGREVETLVDEFVDAGYRQVALDASKLSSGVYLYRMRAGSFVSTRKAVVVK